MKPRLALGLLLAVSIAAGVTAVALLLRDTGTTSQADIEAALERCARFVNKARKERCEEEVLASSGLADELTDAIAESTDPAERDLLRLRLLYIEPNQALELCDEMEGDQGRQLCERFKGRAHLWRDSSRGGGAKGGKRRKGRPDRR